MLRRPQHFTFIGVMLGVSSPVLLYVADLLGVTIPVSVVWSAIYLLGAIPMILAELVGGLVSVMYVGSPMFFLLVSTIQVVMAYLFGLTTVWCGSAVHDVGAFREHRTSKVMSNVVVIVRFYIIAFWSYSLYYLVLGL